MTEEKETKKKNKEFDKDVCEMADVYDQLAKLLKDSPVLPTPDAVEAMAVSITIGRKETKRIEDARKTSEERASATPTNTSAEKSESSSENERVCPTCGTILLKQFGKKSGRGYFSCKKCKQFVNDDGKVVPWKT